MDMEVSPSGWLRWPGGLIKCAVGRNGFLYEKKEGDGCTPVGTFPLRRVFYRPDRLSRPVTQLPCDALTRNDGWCDDPADPRYNRFVRLPYRASAETLWRDDGVYDLIVVLGYNDAPVMPGKGSAIFLHIARDGYAPTEGCIAVSREDLLFMLPECTTDSLITMKPVGSSGGGGRSPKMDLPLSPGMLPDRGAGYGGF